MTVAELIEFLKTQPQDIQVAYREFNEYQAYETACVLSRGDIQVARFSVTWGPEYLIAQRGNEAAQQYLVFPGN